MARHQLLQSGRKVGLQCRIVLQAMCTHIGLDPRVCIPLFSVAFIAADMEVGIREQPRHFAQKLVEKLICFWPGRIHCAIEYAPLLYDLIGACCASKFGIANQP